MANLRLMFCEKGITNRNKLAVRVGCNTVAMKLFEIQMVFPSHMTAANGTAQFVSCSDPIFSQTVVKNHE